MKNHNDDPRPIANLHQVSPDWKNAILHARICIGETKILGADNGGQIFMPMQETFFAVRFAMLRHKFGTSSSLQAHVGAFGYYPGLGVM